MDLEAIVPEDTELLERPKPNAALRYLERDARAGKSAEVVEADDRPTGFETFKSCVGSISSCVLCIGLLLGMNFFGLLLGNRGNVAAASDALFKWVLFLPVQAVVLVVGFIALSVTASMLIWLWQFLKKRSFWDWMERESPGELSGFRVTTLLTILFGSFVVAPGLIYALIKWDPVILHGENYLPLGLPVVFGLYWTTARVVYLNHRSKRRLNQLLDKLLLSDEAVADRFFSTVRSKRGQIKNGNPGTEEGQDRVQWFDIR